MQEAGNAATPTTTDFKIVDLDLSHVEAVLSLWATEDTLRKSTADSAESLVQYFNRNPGISVGAVGENGSLIATVLAGHDGRRGYPKHIFVHPSYRRTGIGVVIMREVIVRLARTGILTCHYSVDATNHRAFTFFQECFTQPDFEVEEIVTSRRFELRYKGAIE